MSEGHVHFGSLEKGERERLSKLSQLEEETKRKLDKLKTQVPKPTVGDSMHDLSEASQQSIARQQELKETIDRRKRARELAVPTNDNAVKLKLREYGEAIIIFGEMAPERRERLRHVAQREAAHGRVDTRLEHRLGCRRHRRVSVLDRRGHRPAVAHLGGGDHRPDARLRLDARAEERRAAPLLLHLPHRPITQHAHARRPGLQRGRTRWSG